MRTLGRACVAFAFALLAAPVLAQEVGDVAAGGAYFAENCAECHEKAAELAGMLDQADPQATRAGLQEFLADHFAEDETDRENVIAYLMSI
jgi:mono/diheme cytochrome c family protein